jgi:STE24 endopeptidase
MGEDLMAQGFDPAAATAAYLSVLTPEQHLKAQQYTQGGHWMLLWGAVVAVLAAWLILRSGVLVRVRQGVERKRPRVWLAALMVLGLNAVLEPLLGLPWAAYASWWRERTYGLTDRTLGGWAGEWLISTLMGAVLTAVVLSLLYALIRRAPKTWWAWGGALIGVTFVAMLLLLPVFIQPIFNTYRPAPPGPTRDAVVQLAKATGVPSDRIFVYDGSKQSNRYTANVAGLGGTVRISMSDVMFDKGADIAEVRAVVAHEIGHYKTGQIFTGALFFGLMAAAGFFLTDRLYPVVRRWTGAEAVGGLSDPAGYPIVSMILTVLLLLATPLYASFTRIGETQADRYSMEHAREPDGMARALMKTVEYRAATPSRWEEIIFYDHPAVGNRVRRAMEWKAAHPEPPPR